MDIESSFRRLQDDAGWRLARLEPRAHAVEAAQHRVSPARWWVIGIAATAMVVVAALVVVGIVSWRGGATQPIAPPTSSTPASQTPTSDPTPSETPTADPDPLPSSAPVIFDGDCSALFSEAQASEFLGAEVPAASTSPVIADPIAVELYAAGGLVCSWGHATILIGGMYGAAGMTVEIAPVSFADPRAPSSSTCTPTRGYGVSSCRLVASTYAYTASASVEIESEDVQAGELETQLQSALARATLREPEQGAWRADPDAWHGSLDCEALFAAPGVQDALGKAPQSDTTRQIAPNECYLPGAADADAQQGAYVFVVSSADDALHRLAGVEGGLSSFGSVGADDAYGGPSALESPYMIWVHHGEDAIGVSPLNISTGDDRELARSWAAPIIAGIDAQR